MRDRSAPAVPEEEDAASRCQNGPSVLYSQQKGVTAMIKLIPSPKTYEISDELLRFPLKLFHGEPGRPLGTHLERPPQMHRRRIHRNVPSPTPPPRPPHPGQMNMPEGRCTHRPSVRFDTMPILSSQKALCFVVGYKYPSAVEKCLLF